MRLSPVSITISSPSSCSARSLLRVVVLIGSATPTRPGELAVDRDEHDGLPLRGAARRPASRARAGSTPQRLRGARGCRCATRWPSTTPMTPSPGDRLEALRRRRAATSRSVAPATIARGKRMLADASRGCAARRSSVDVVELPRLASTVTSRGLPSVSVPVLSTTSVVDLLAGSRALRRCESARRLRRRDPCRP